MLRVAVVGCGTAGGATAILLSRLGHHVEVLERVEDPKPVGAGIVLQPTGQRVLTRLGLDPVLGRGARLDSLRCVTASGRKIVELDYGLVGNQTPGEQPLFGLGMHRGAIFEAIYAAALQESASLKLGVGVHRVERRRFGSRTESTLFDESGNAYGPYDLVVVADGARSKLRDFLVPEALVEPYPYGAFWFIGRDVDGTFTNTSQLFQIVDGNHRMLGCLPTGIGPSTDDLPDEPMLSLYWSARVDEVGEFRNAGLADWKATILGYEPRLEPLMTQLHDLEQVLFSSYVDVRIPRAAHEREMRDGLVFIGDAAHAMSPQLGQGCNLALLDALTLGECFHVFGDVQHALTTYESRRRIHLGLYKQATRWLTPFFQGDMASLGLLRDIFMGPMSAIPLARRLMSTSMAGTLTSWFGHQIELPRLPK